MSRILRPEQQAALKRRIFVDVNFWKRSLPGFALISDGLSVVAKCRCPEQEMTSGVSKVCLPRERITWNPSSILALILQLGTTTLNPASPKVCYLIILQHFSAVIVNTLHSGISTMFAIPSFILQTAPRTE
jgi:hypothetical protein